MRSFVSSGSIGVLLWALTVAPFVHLHPNDHDGRATVHGHLPAHHHMRHAGDSRPSVDGGEQEGHHVDVFSSVPGKRDPQAVCLEAAPDLTPTEVARLESWSEDPGWKRGPPPEESSPRAPPHTFLAV